MNPHGSCVRIFFFRVISNGMVFHSIETAVVLIFVFEMQMCKH